MNELSESPPREGSWEVGWSGPAGFEYAVGLGATWKGHGVPQSYGPISSWGVLFSHLPVVESLGVDLWMEETSFLAQLQKSL